MWIEGKGALSGGMLIVEGLFVEGGWCQLGMTGGMCMGEEDKLAKSIALALIFVW